LEAESKKRNGEMLTSDVNGNGHESNGETPEALEGEEESVVKPDVGESVVSVGKVSKTYRLGPGDSLGRRNARGVCKRCGFTSLSTVIMLRHRLLHHKSSASGAASEPVDAGREVKCVKVKPAAAAASSTVSIMSEMEGPECVDYSLETGSQ